MIILTKRRLARVTQDIIDAVHDASDFEVEVNGPRDYGITPYVYEKERKELPKTIYKILRGN